MSIAVVFFVTVSGSGGLDSLGVCGPAPVSSDPFCSLPFLCGLNGPFDLVRERFEQAMNPEWLQIGAFDR